MARTKRKRTQIEKRLTMGFDRQQELLREHYIVNRALTWNEMLMLKELTKRFKPRPSARTSFDPNQRVNARWLAVGAGISDSAARRALKKLIARHLVHLIPAHGYRLRVTSK